MGLWGTLVIFPVSLLAIQSSSQMKAPCTNWCLAAMAIVLVSMCLAAKFVPFPLFAVQLSAFSNGIQAVLLLLATLLMIRNGLLSHAKAKYFWYCMALGCGL